MQSTWVSEAQLAFLLAARTGHLATVDAEGRPHVLPVCFAILNGVVYTPLDEKPKRVEVRELRRVRNILGNPAACLVVDRYREDWVQLAWIQIRGDAGLLEPGGSEHAAAVAVLRERYQQYRSMALERRPLLRLKPNRIVSWGI